LSQVNTDSEWQIVHIQYETRMRVEELVL
jgi:hypothetical protein